MTEKEPLFQSGESAKKEEKGLFGINPELSLQSVNFSPWENSYLSEHYEQPLDKNDEK